MCFSLFNLPTFKTPNFFKGILPVGNNVAERFLFILKKFIKVPENTFSSRSQVKKEKQNSEISLSNVYVILVKRLKISSHNHI